MGFVDNLSFGFSPKYAALRMMVLQYDEQQLRELCETIRQSSASPSGKPQDIFCELTQLRELCEEIRQGIPVQNDNLLRPLAQLREMCEEIQTILRRPAPADGSAFPELREQCSAILAAVSAVEKELHQLRAECSLPAQNAELQQVLAEVNALQHPAWLEPLIQGQQRMEYMLSQIHPMPAPDPRIPSLETENAKLKADIAALRQEHNSSLAGYGRLQAEQKELLLKNAQLQEDNEKKQKRIKELEALIPNIPAPVPAPIAPQNPYALGDAQFCFSSAAEVVQRFGNIKPLDDFFSDVETDSLYHKIYTRFRKKLTKLLGQADEDDELPDLLESVFAKLIYSDLLKGLVVAVYRKQKNGEAAFENRMLSAVNAYLLSAGVYNRTDLHKGGLMAERDYADMNFIPDHQTQGMAKGTIIEIELYPYYVDYLDENGDRQPLCAQGMMVVTA